VKKRNPIKIYIILIAALIITSIVLISIIVVNKNKINVYDTTAFKVTYDNNWLLNKKNNNSLSLVHRSGSTFNIEITYLQSKYRRTDLSVLIEDILEKIEKDNPNYKLVNKEKGYASNKKYDSYKYLYETTNYQVLIEIGKKNDKIFVITYIAQHVHFDILLDSVKDIIWNFELSV